MACRKPFPHRRGKNARTAGAGGDAMSERRRHPIWTWVIHTPWVLAVLSILAIAGFFLSGAGNPLIRRLIIQRVESITGRNVEVRTVSIRWLALGVTLKGLVFFCNEPATTET